MNLDALRVEQGCRIRGEAVTRLETFVDAAFAFAVTLLVVSFEAMPESFAELYDALRRFPAFVAGFAILAMFWASHHRFSRRFGLEDGTVVVLSLALVAGTLFYVYPLRMVMSAGLHFMTNGWAPSELEVNSAHEYRMVWIIYGSGFAVLAGIMALLNRHALRHAAILELDAAERVILRMEIGIMSILMGCALLSIGMTFLIGTAPSWAAGLPGMAYALLGLVIPLYAVRAQKEVARLAALRPQSVASASAHAEPVMPRLVPSPLPCVADRHQRPE